MRYRFVGTLMMLGSLLSSSDLYAAKRCRKEKCIQPKPCPKPKKCPPRVTDPCEDRIGKGPGYADCDLPPAYSGPARINPHCGWDLNVSASFIYWLVSQEGMDFAVYDNGETPVNRAGLITQKFDFKPGFKVAAGSYLGTDDWEGKFEYTRLHFTTRSNTFAPNTTNGSLLNNSFSRDVLTNAAFDNQLVTQAKSKWKVKMDLMDLSTTRWFYSGHMFTMGPHMGVRGGFIDQYMDVSVIESGSTAFSRAKNKSKSWLIGPRFGLDMNWILGYGLRAYGKATRALLYQRARTEANNASLDNTNTADSGIFKNTFRQVIPNSELSLGIGWGTYLAEDAFHIDILASYDFQVIEKQNLMRQNTDALDGTYHKAGDLTSQGLTVKVQFNF